MRKLQPLSETWPGKSTRDGLDDFAPVFVEQLRVLEVRQMSQRHQAVEVHVVEHRFELTRVVEDLSRPPGVSR